MIKSIFYEQDQEDLTEIFKNVMELEEIFFLSDYLVNEISVGGLYEFFIIKDEVTKDINIYVTKIIQINENDNLDYIISGTDEREKRIKVKLSKTKFWTS